MPCQKVASQSMLARASRGPGGAGRQGSQLPRLPCLLEAARDQAHIREKSAKPPTASPGTVPGIASQRSISSFTSSAHAVQRGIGLLERNQPSPSATTTWPSDTKPPSASQPSTRASPPTYETRPNPRDSKQLHHLSLRLTRRTATRASTTVSKPKPRLIGIASDRFALALDDETPLNVLRAFMNCWNSSFII
jgi:hypothetical protein